MIAMPTRPAINPPVLNEMKRGARFEKSLAGLTTLAAMFTEIVAIPMPRNAVTATIARAAGEAINGSACAGGGTGDVSWLRMNSDFHSSLTSTPERTDWAALVTITPMAEN